MTSSPPNPARSRTEAPPVPKTPTGRVLQVVGTSHALPYQVVPLALSLREAGWEVDVACPEGPEAEEARGMGLRHLRIDFSRRMVSLSHAAEAFRLARLIRSRRYDVVHVHGPIPSVVGRTGAAFTSAAIVYHCRGTFYDGQGSASERVLSWIFPPIERLLAPATDHAFTLNASDARDLVNRARMAADRVTSLGVGGVGLDLTHWNPSRFPPSRRRELRESMGVPVNRWTVGFAGRIVRAKGILEVVQAFGCLVNRGVDGHLVIAGGTLDSERDQRTSGEARRMIAELGIHDRVTFTGHVDDLAPVLAMLDVLALPSYREGFGQVIVEAGAIGVPSVAARSRGTNEAVLDGETGLLVPPRDVDALTAALARMHDDADLTRGMGLAAAARAAELGQPRVVEQIRRVYDRIMRERNR